jgi:adenosylcobinamide amidohydrolase
MHPEYFNDYFSLYRQSRFATFALHTPHWVLSTCTCNGGIHNHITHIANHQSCEASATHPRASALSALLPKEQQAFACHEASLPSQTTVILGTAAHMSNGIHEYSIAPNEHLEVHCFATAGVEGNAACAGDPGYWVEHQNKWHNTKNTNQTLPKGTINIIVWINQTLTHGTLAQAAYIIAEAKATALRRLAVYSKQSPEPATGTGTDQYAIACPANRQYPLSNCGHHTRLGELIGTCVIRACTKALALQNNRHPSTPFNPNVKVTIPATISQESVLTNPDIQLFFQKIAHIQDLVRWHQIPAHVGLQEVKQAACLLLCTATHDFTQFNTHYKTLSLCSDYNEIVNKGVAQYYNLKWENSRP